MKGVMRFGKKGKLSPTDVCPYKILKKVDKVAYDLELPIGLEVVHQKIPNDNYDLRTVGWTMVCIPGPSTLVLKIHSLNQTKKD